MEVDGCVNLGVSSESPSFVPARAPKGAAVRSPSPRLDETGSPRVDSPRVGSPLPARVAQLQREGSGSKSLFQRMDSLGTGASALFKRTLSLNSNFVATLGARKGVEATPVICAVLTFADAVSEEVLIDLMGRFLRGSPRYRCCVAPTEEGGSDYEWREVPDIDLRRDALTYTQLLAPKNLDEHLSAVLEKAVFEEGKLQWRLVAITYADCPRMDLVFQINHVLADGITLVSLFKHLVDKTEPEAADKAKTNPESTAPERKRSYAQWALEWGTFGWNTARSVARIAMMPHLPDKPTALSSSPEKADGKYTTGHIQADLPAIKANVKARGCTVNDAVLGAIADGASRYLKEVGPVPEKLTIACIVDVRMTRGVSVEQYSELSRPGNWWTWVLVPMRMTGAVMDKVKNAHKFMEYVKRSPEPWIMYWSNLLLIKVMGMFGAMDYNMEIFNKCVTIPVSTLRGPAHACTIGGHKLLNIRYCVRPMDFSGIFTVISYHDHINIMLSSNDGILEDPDRLLACVKGSLDDLSVKS